MRSGVSSARVGAVLSTSDSQAKKVGCGGMWKRNWKGADAATGHPAPGLPGRATLPSSSSHVWCWWDGAVNPANMSCFPELLLLSPDCCPSHQGRTGNPEETCRGWAWTARGPVWPALSRQAALSSHCLCPRCLAPACPQNG